MHRSWPCYLNQCCRSVFVNHLSGVWERCGYRQEGRFGPVCVADAGTIWVTWLHSTCTRCWYVGNFLMAFLSSAEWGSDSHSRPFLRRGCSGGGVVFPSCWGAGGQQDVLKAIFRELEKVLFMLVRKAGAADVWSYPAAFMTCQDNIWVCPKVGSLCSYLQALSLSHDLSRLDLFCFWKSVWT